MIDTLLRRKLRLPSASGVALERPDLVARLERAAFRGSITLFHAPAGWGKTRLAAEWTATVEEPIAWLSLDRSDESVEIFWRYLVAALAPCVPALLATELELAETNCGLGARELATRVSNGLEDATGPLMLALDGYDRLETEAVRDAVSSFLQSLPDVLRAVVTSRSRIPLARARADGRVLEVDRDWLRFQPDEIEALASELGGDLDRGAAETLFDLTEGWPVGVTTTVACLEDAPDTGAATYVGIRAHRRIIEYLTAEVLDVQPVGVRDFLLRTSILDSLCSGVCAAVVDSTDQVVTLADIDAAGLFLVPLDDEGRWFRYERMFAAALRRELEEEQAELVPVLFERAAHWHEEHGLASDAIEYAVSAADGESLSQLVADHYPTLFKSGRLQVLDDVLANHIPDSRIRRDSHLALARTLLHVANGQMHEAERWSRILADAPTQRGPFAGYLPSVNAALALVRSQFAYYGGDLRNAVRWAEIGRKGEADQPSDDGYVASFVLAAERLRRGAPEAALALLVPEEQWARETGNALHLLYLHPLQAAAWLQLGDVEAASSHLDCAATLAQDQQLEQSPINTLPQLLRAWLTLSHGDTTLAHSQAATAVELGRSAHDRLCRIDTLQLQAAVSNALGDRVAARAARHQATRLLDVCADPGIPLLRTFWSASSVVDGELTLKQTEVLSLVAEGCSNAEIARRLAISERTVHAHLRAIFVELDVPSRTAAVHAGRERYLI